MFLAELSWKINHVTEDILKLEENAGVDALMRSIFLYLGFLAVGWWVVGSLLFLLLLLVSPLPYSSLLRARNRLLDLGEILGVVEPVAGKKRPETFEECARRRAAEANPYRSAAPYYEVHMHTRPAPEKTTTAKEEADREELRKRRVHIREVAGGGESQR